MTRKETEMYQINIEAAASIISSNIGQHVVNSVFNRYDTSNVYDLNPADLPDVFDELSAIEDDLR